MSAFHDVILAGASGSQGYQISRSVRLRSSASAYFNRTLTNNGNSTKWTFGVWLKRGRLGVDQTIFGSSSGTSTNFAQLKFDSSDRLDYTEYTTSIVANRITSAVYRDPSAYYNIVFCYDSGNAIASDRLKLYVNGVEVTAFSSSTNPSLNATSFINYVTGNVNNIGRLVFSGAGANYFDGYLTEVNFIDGQALTPSSFGETDAVTGVWKPKKYVGTYGTNGFYLNFSDPSAATAAAIGKDYSGNGNNWTPNNISVTAGVTYDSMLDVPTMYADGGNGRGNYCTLNPLDRNSSASVLDGNLNVNTSAVNVGVRASIGVNSGKWYWEATVSAIGSTNVDIGVADSAWSRDYVGSSASSWGYFSSGQKYNNGAASAYGATYTTGDIIGVAFDADAGTLTFYKNGTSQGQAFTGVSGSNPMFPAVSGQTSSTLVCNFGQRPFAYTPPTGFKALNTQNLPDSTIKKGNQFFDATLYTGNGSALTVTNNGSMQPDLLWTKQRSSTAWHYLQDAVRGVNKALFSNATDAEYSITPTTTTLNSNGFSFNGAESGLNANGATYVAWQWKESASAGFDIVTLTNPASGSFTVNHSLGVAPSMFLFKDRNAAGSIWSVYHKSLGDGRLQLQSTAAVTTGVFTTAPTSTNITLPASYADGATAVVYLFAEVAGFSRFGSYTGNGSTDGPFVYCGFRPRYVLVKNASDGTGQWIVNDSARGTYNQPANALYPNISNAEDTSHPIDFYANGFKPRSSAAHSNGSGNTIIYAAFAENPFKNSLAR